MDQNFFKNIESKTGVNMKDVFELANSLQGANFKDEATVRNVIKRVSQIANKPVTKRRKIKLFNRLLQTENNWISVHCHS